MNTELLIQLSKFIIPALMLFGAVYYFTNRWFEIQEQKNKIEAKKLAKKTQSENQLVKHFFPLQVDAAQRLVLFLERINPNNMVMRLQNPGLPARAFQQKLLTNIRSEFEHNLAQQIFVSSDVWLRVVTSKDEIVKIIISAATELEPTALAGDLSQKIFEITSQLKHQPTDLAIESIKKEIRENLN